MPKSQPAALAHDDWRFRGAAVSAAQGHAKALEQLFEMLADEQRQLTHQDRLALIALIKQLTTSGKRGRQRGKVFSRAWLVRQLAQEARARHRREQEAWRRDRWKNPRPSLKGCAEQAVERWKIAEFTRLAAEHAGQDLTDQIADLEIRSSDITSSVLTELRGRGVAKRRRGRGVK